MNKNIFRALGEKAFLFLWLGEVFTQIGINIFNFFLILVVYSLTTSNTAVSGVILTVTVPAILFGVLAGVYVDHWNKKRVLYMVNILRAILLILLALFHTNLIVIYTVSVLISLLTQFFIPAESPLIPLIVKEKVLLSANALFGLGIYGSLLIAYVISGPIIIFFGQVNTLLLLSLFLFIGAFFLSFIDVPETKLIKDNVVDKSKKTTAMLEIQKALSLMSSTREIHHSLFLLAISQILILIIATIAPGYASQVLDIHVEQFPLLFITPAAIGVITGALLIAYIFENTDKDKIINVGLFLSGIAMLILPFGSKIASKGIVQTINVSLPHVLYISVDHIVIFIAFLLGFANAFVFVPSNTTLLEKTKDEFRGKIYGVLNTIIGIFSLVPIIVVGGLSDLVGIPRVIIGIGIILLGIWISRLLHVL